jgi:outer membrane protein assembly factor BamB
MKEAGGRARALEAKMGPLQKQQRKLNNKVKALQKRKKKAPATAPADPALEKEIEQIKGQVKQLGKEIKVLQDQLKPLNAARRSKADKTNGYSSATPASDGRVVCVVFGTGVVACYDMEGNRKWVKFIEKPTQRDGYGHCASPLIAGDRVLVVIENVTALDLKSGQVVWTARSKHQWGSPVAARIGDTDVAITANGEIVRIADGTVLAGGVARLEYCTAVVKDGIVYFIENGGKAIRLPAKASDSIEVKELWKTTPKKDRYYASPVVHDGLIYACTQSTVFSVIDAEDGKVVYEKKLNLGGGTMYPSMTLAGGLLYVSIDNGTTVVLEPGREYKEIARNELEPFRTTPVFIGKRMYVRGLKNLYCVGE